MAKVRLIKNVDDITFNLDKFKKDSNILIVTGLSGSGKSYLSKSLAKEHNASIFQPEWLKHTKHITPEFKPMLESFFDIHPNIVDLAKAKWNNAKSEDKNELFKKYINLFFEHFLSNIDKDKLYIVEGLQIFSLIDFKLIKNYPIIIKGTSSTKSLKNRYKRDLANKNITKRTAKFKFLMRILKESRLYQFKHRKVLNKFIKNYTLN